MMNFPDDFFRLIELEETDSTNNYLSQLALQDKIEEFTVVTAKFQTAGKGQKGNIWYSKPDENLLFSVLLKPHFIPPAEQFILSQIISLSIKKELDNYSSDFRIKWPNDIFWKDRKICGILIENNIIGSQISESILGAGININQKEFSSEAGSPVSLYQITSSMWEKGIILSRIIENLYSFYQEIRSDRRVDINSLYNDSLYRKEGLFKYEDNNGIFEAELERVEPSGFLILKDRTGKNRKYAFKEVRFVT